MGHILRRHNSGHHRHHRTRTCTRRSPCGIRSALVEMGARGSYRVRLRSGALITANLDPAVDPKLVHQCIRERRPMLIELEEGQAFIIGALQTQAHPTATLSADRVELTGEQKSSSEQETASSPCTPTAR